jgi:hypothetical protein
MKALGSFAALVNIYQLTWRSTPQDFPSCFTESVHLFAYQNLPNADFLDFYTEKFEFLGHVPVLIITGHRTTITGTYL